MTETQKGRRPPSGGCPAFLHFPHFWRHRRNSPKSSENLKDRVRKERDESDIIKEKGRMTVKKGKLMMLALTASLSAAGLWGCRGDF